MARRTFWLAAGAVVGAGSSLYAERKVRRTLEQAADRLRPEALVVQAGQSARQAATATGGRFRAALDSGRTEMARREEELWTALAGGASSTEVRDASGTPSGAVRPRYALDVQAVDAGLASGPAGDDGVGRPVRSGLSARRLRRIRPSRVAR